jgi:hypothetical protein
VATIYSVGTTLATNVTIVGNVSSGATISSLADNGPRITLKNSLIASNISRVADYGITDAGFNMSATASPAFTQTTSSNNVDLKVSEAADFGGPTPTVPLLTGSPAIDAGDDSAAPPTDQRGRPRFGRSDIGAFESTAPFTIHGRLAGYLNGTAFVKVENETLQPDTGGFFKFNVSTGIHSVQFVGPADLVFRTSSPTVNVLADTEIHARLFKASSFAIDPELATPGYTFAASGGTWRFDLSHDLSHWTPISTNQFSSPGLYSIGLNNFTPPTFLQAVQQP